MHFDATYIYMFHFNSFYPLQLHTKVQNFEIIWHSLDDLKVFAVLIFNFHVILIHVVFQKLHQFMFVVQI